MKASKLWKELLKNPHENKDILKEIERLARENTDKTEIHFGTSGWRGEIGEIGSDFTFHNLRVLTKALIEAVKSEDRNILKSIGVNSFNEFKERGVIVGHDNRILGKEFSMEVMGMLQNEKIKCFYAGESSTPEFSAGIVESGVAA